MNFLAPPIHNLAVRSLLNLLLVPETLVLVDEWIHFWSLLHCCHCILCKIPRKYGLRTTSP